MIENKGQIKNIHKVIIGENVIIGDSVFIEGRKVKSNIKLQSPKSQKV